MVVIFNFLFLGTSIRFSSQANCLTQVFDSVNQILTSLHPEEGCGQGLVLKQSTFLGTQVSATYAAHQLVCFARSSFHPLSFQL